MSEVGWNVVTYGRKGHITLKGIQNSSHVGILVVASDHGPGIPDIPQALRDGFSTSGSLGLGLPGVRRLMDEFEITSQPGGGTTVAGEKWKQNKWRRCVTDSPNFALSLTGTCGLATC